MQNHKQEFDPNLLEEEKIRQIRIKIDTYHEMLSRDMISMEKYTDDLKKIIALGSRIQEETNIEPIKFVFWHNLVGSTLEKGRDQERMEFDTPNHDIEKFVDELLENK